MVAIEHRGTEPEGIAIANELDIRYDGIQESVGNIPAKYQFTDPITGSTFYGDTLEKAKINLANMRAKFKATTPAKVLTKRRKRKAPKRRAKKPPTLKGIW